MARPSTLTSELQARIVAAMRTGHCLGVACELSGISRRTGYEWLFRGRGDDKDRPATTLYTAFAQAVHQAAADAAVKPSLGLIQPFERRVLTITTEHWPDGTTVTHKVWRVSE
jgi:hypothetical protein